jgi:hypothetical protein
VWRTVRTPPQVFIAPKQSSTCVRMRRRTTQPG